MTVAKVPPKQPPDHRQERTTPVRARAQASRESLVQAAMALWRTNGFAATSVTDICKAAGVSKALFYVYFSRKEDVLYAAELFQMQDAHVAAAKVASKPYELVDLIATVIDPLIKQMSSFPADLIFEAVMENYRIERRALAEGEGASVATMLFLEPLERAQADGKLPASLDPLQAARIAQTLASDGIRRWAATSFADRSVARNLAGEIADVLQGLGARRT